MEKNITLKDKFADLRKREEKMIDTVPDHTAWTQSFKETWELIQELQIHQIELEMQNKELRRSQSELEAARKKYSDLYDFAPTGYFTMSEEGLILEANLTGARMLGVERRDLKGSRFTHFITPDTQDIFYLHRKKLIETKRNQSCELRFLRKDDSEFWVQLACVPVEDDEGNIIAFQASVSDIEERMRAEAEKNRLESQLQQSQKMESIGDLAGGIAHDFNNLLFSIVGMAELLLEDLSPLSLEYQNAKQILKAGERGSELVQQILTFSRKADHKMVPLRVQEIMKEVLKLIRLTIPSNIEITQNLQGDCGVVMADATQLHQVAMNLITNAYHAVEQTEGNISVELKESVLETQDLADTPLKPESYVKLSVSDTGCGIDPDVRDKIFDPYFTTKEQGKGTGLGLSVVYGIIKEYGGHIKVQSDLGIGTTVEVYLPLLETPSQSESIKDVKIHPAGSERILLVDDEEIIVHLEKQMLERLGYHVKPFTNSLDALSAFRSDLDAFDLVITDMAMPKMTGVQLAEKLFSVRQDIPIIVCTGFSERMNEKEAERLGISGLLKKPISKSDMAGMVRKVLDEAKSSGRE